LTTYGIDRTTGGGGAGTSTTVLLADGSQPLTDDWDTGSFGIDVGGLFSLSGIVSATLGATPVHNWTITGLENASVIRMGAAGTTSVTGLAGGTPGRTLFIHNVSGFEISFESESGSSTAANRFALTNTVTLQDNQVAVFQYDGTESRWRIVSSSGSSGSVLSTNIVTRNFTGDASTTTFALGATPTSESVVLVFLDGVFQNNTEWTLSGSDLTFSTAPADGVAIETRTCDVLAIGTPSDNTVSTAKLQAESVTQAKLDPTTYKSNFRNAVMNGSFDIWQRGASFAAIASGSYSADRWRYANVGAAVHTISRSTDVPTVAQAGVLAPYSMLVDCTTVDSSVAAGDLVAIQQRIEGTVWRRFAQRDLVITFWVKATKTGIHCVSLNNAAGDRSLVAEYTINTTNTWEKKTVTFTASPSAGTWDFTSTGYTQLAFTLMAGSTWQTTAGSWQNGLYLATANQVNACDSTSNDFRLALVQLEAGSVATPFEDIPFEVELSRCQRYYETGESEIWRGQVTNGVTVGQLNVRFATPKRTTGFTAGMSIVGVANFPPVSPTAGSSTIGGFNAYLTADGTADDGYFLFNWTLSAEL
jgi:hypothetical protein